LEQVGSLRVLEVLFLDKERFIVYGHYVLSKALGHNISSYKDKTT
jgi:hypothetical protein